MAAKWEKVISGTVRLRVPGGWIINTYGHDQGDTSVYLPDPNHAWLDDNYCQVCYGLDPESEHAVGCEL